MGIQLVFVPCRLDRRDARTALIEDADGWPRKVASPLGRVEGKLCVAARWLREANGRHRVVFGDGAELWVTPGPSRQEEFVPLGWGPESPDLRRAGRPKPASPAPSAGPAGVAPGRVPDLA
jgi:hypothetical protein